MAWDDEFFRRWRKRWFSSPFEFMDEIMREMDRIFEEEVKEFRRIVPPKLFRERRAEDGSIIREYGPLIFGYSITIGPDGKPVIRHFGNVKPRGELGVQEVREPLVDIFETDKDVKVIVELPGAEKDQIKLVGRERSLTVEVADTEGAKYYKEIELPVAVDHKNSTSTYRNGILEVTLPKHFGGKGSTRIPVQ